MDESAVENFWCEVVALAEGTKKSAEPVSKMTSGRMTSVSLRFVPIRQTAWHVTLTKGLSRRANPDRAVIRRILATGEVVCQADLAARGALDHLVPLPVRCSALTAVALRREALPFEALCAHEDVGLPLGQSRVDVIRLEVDVGLGVLVAGAFEVVHEEAVCVVYVVVSELADCNARGWKKNYVLEVDDSVSVAEVGHPLRMLYPLVAVIAGVYGGDCSAQRGEYGEEGGGREEHGRRRASDERRFMQAASVCVGGDEEIQGTEQASR